MSHDENRYDWEGPAHATLEEQGAANLRAQEVERAWAEKVAALDDLEGWKKEVAAMRDCPQASSGRHDYVYVRTRTTEVPGRTIRHEGVDYTSTDRRDVEVWRCRVCFAKREVPA